MDEKHTGEAAPETAGQGTHDAAWPVMRRRPPATKNARSASAPALIDAYAGSDSHTVRDS